MFLTSKIKLCALIWLICIAIILINTTPVIAQGCVPCNTVPTCPPCPEGSKCILPLRTCFECPKPRCSQVKLPADNNKNSKAILPVVIGSILGVGLLAVLGYCCFVWRRRTRNERGVKLDNNEEMISVDGENVIPIAYIPSSPKPEPVYSRNISCSARNFGDERLNAEVVSDVGTILQATKTASTTTIMTATRAKPALFRLNTIKPDIEIQFTRNESSNSNTPKTPTTSNTLLSAPSISSVPGSPISDYLGDSDTERMMPRIDVERSSVESFHVTNQNLKSQHLNSPPIEGRQSFGLFGSDEVYSKNSSSPQLRGSIISSSSSNGRSTLASDEGDGEIMIFWGGNAPPFVNVGCQSREHSTQNVGQNVGTKLKGSI